MKLKTFLLPILLMAISSCYVHGQETSREELLEGSWLFEDVSLSSFTTMEAKAKQSLDTIPTLRLTVENAYRGRILLFNGDGTYSITLTDGRNEIGTWNLSPDGNTLTLVNTTGGSVNKMVTIVNPARMILTTPTIEGRGKPVLSQTPLYQTLNS